MHQANTSLDSVYRYNLYHGQAVFLMHTASTEGMENMSLFDFDFTHNIVFFDSLGDPNADM